MKSLLFAAAMLLLASAADAGTITVTVVTAGAPCNAGACTKTYTDTDANLAKIITAYGPNCQIARGSACTALQTLAFWFDGVIARAARDTNAVLRENAFNALPVDTIDPK